MSLGVEKKPCFRKKEGFLSGDDLRTISKEGELRTSVLKRHPRLTGGGGSDGKGGSKEFDTDGRMVHRVRGKGGGAGGLDVGQTQSLGVARDYLEYRFFSGTWQVPVYRPD